jgi:hypothetical protein
MMSLLSLGKMSGMCNYRVIIYFLHKLSLFLEQQSTFSNWTEDYLQFYVPLKFFSLIWRQKKFEFRKGTN